MSMYWSKLSSTALVCIVDLSCIVDLKCACWNIAYAEELLPISYVSLGMYRKRRNYCRGVISVQENLPHSLWVSLDLHDILAIIWTPAYPVVSICVCWPPNRRVYNITSSPLLHRKYIWLLYCLLKVSQYWLALIDIASFHIVKGISHHIDNICRSIILLQEPLPHPLWISLHLHGILAIVWTPAYSVFLSVCVGHLSAVFTTSRHRLYCTESISYFTTACSKCRSIG